MSGVPFRFQSASAALGIACSWISCVWPGEPSAPAPAAKAPVASLNSGHKAAFQAALLGPEKDREKQRKAVADWGPLTKKAADELRKWVATGWTFPPQPGGWQGNPSAAGGMRELDVPGLGKREYYLALPPQPYSPARACPLLISLHGAGGNGKGEFQWCWAKWAKQWPGFIACPSGVPAGQQWFKAGKFGEDQQPFILALLADLRRNFNIDEDRVVIHGFSNGGNGAWYYGMHYPSFFAALVTRGGGACTPGYENLLHVPSFIVHGDKDSVIKPDSDRKGAARLKELGYDATYKELPGGHDPFLEQTNPEILAWLAKQKRNAYPPKIAFQMLEARAKRAYWVEIVESQGGKSEVGAEAKENKIVLRASGVKELALWLADDLLDLEKPVVVELGGKTVHDAPVPRSGAALLEWLSATGDRAAAPVARLVIRP